MKSKFGVLLLGIGAFGSANADELQSSTILSEPEVVSQQRMEELKRIADKYKTHSGESSQPVASEILVTTEIREESYPVDNNPSLPVIEETIIEPIEIVPVNDTRYPVPMKQDQSYIIKPIEPKKVQPPLPAATRFYRAPFEGLAILAGIGYSRDKISYSTNETGSSKTDSNVTAEIGAEYGIPVTEEFIATVGVSYSLNKTKFDDLVVTPSGGNISTDSNIISTEMKNHFSIYVAPGYKLKPDVLIYSKLGYHYAKGKYSDTYIPLGGVKFGSGEKSFGGFGVGAGASYHATPNFINSVELQYINYSKQNEFISSGKVSSTALTAFLKYRF